MSKRIVVVSDLHVGSDVGLKPDKVYLNEDDPMRKTPSFCNVVQQDLLSHWEEFVDRVGKVDVLVANGDLCEGVNHKSKGLGCWTTDRNIQVKAAAQLLDMFHAKKVIGTQGSLYHTDDNISTDKAVIDSLKGTFDDELALKVDGVRMHFSHKVGTSSSAWMYRTTPIAREMMLAVLTEPEFGKFDIICRSHAHYFCTVGYSHSLGIITPCWKGRDAFAKRLTMAYVPTNGGIVIDVDGGEYDWDPYLFTLKGDRVIKEVRV